MTDAKTITASWVRHRVWACPRCGSHQTGLHGSNEIACAACRKTFRVADPGHVMPLPASLKDLRWEAQAADEHGNSFSIWDDTVYGRRWLLEVNLLGSGYRFLYGGAFWRLKTARKAADYFRRSWVHLLVDPGFREHYGLPDGAIDLVRLRERAEVVDSLVSGNHPFPWHGW